MEICRRVGINDACVAIDPTLLYGKNSYESLIDSKVSTVEKPYVFIYALNIVDSNKMHWPEIEKIAIEEHLDVKVCSSSGYLVARDFIPGHTNLHLTVEQWLKTIQNAKFVVTSSFHGTVFCLLMHVPFVSVPLDGEHKKANDRLLTLLKTVELEERLMCNEKDISSIINKSIDWEIVDSKLEDSRLNSILFLEKALNGL